MTEDNFDKSIDKVNNSDNVDSYNKDESYNSSESEDILKIFIEKGFLLDKDMLNFLKELGDNNTANEILNKIAVISHKKIITKNLISENIDKIKPILFELDSEKKKLVEKYFVNVNISIEVKKERSIEDKNKGGESQNESRENKNDSKEGRKNLENLKSINNVKIISSPVIASQKIEVSDFVKYFRNRFNVIKNLLQSRPELDNLVSIDKITNNRNFSIIGMVRSKEITKNKNIILEAEDLTGVAKLLVNQNKEEIYKKAKQILLDDVIGFKCSGSRDFLFVNDFFYPDSFLLEKKRTKEEVYALFISDIHVGSKNFLEKNFSRFIEWLNEGVDIEERGVDIEERGVDIRNVKGGVSVDARRDVSGNIDGYERRLQEKVKYIFVVGDTIDGVGIYPGQEKDLAIKDIKEQYRKLAEFYRKIPEHIPIIQCAGQHDAVRIAEPQPPVGADFAEALHEIKNLYLVSNPSFIEIEGGNCISNGNGVRKGSSDGIRILMYHGASMHGIINEIEELRLANAHSTPAKVIKHLLLRRHLAPSHGEATYIPSDNDAMLIKEVPDIITTGDLHRTDIDSYNNILIVSNSCWQAKTAFEEKMGNVPDPCKVPLLNLKTGEIRVLDFSDDSQK